MQNRLDIPSPSDLARSVSTVQMCSEYSCQVAVRVHVLCVVGIDQLCSTLWDP